MQDFISDKEANGCLEKQIVSMTTNDQDLVRKLVKSRAMWKAKAEDKQEVKEIHKEYKEKKAEIVKPVVIEPSKPKAEVNIEVNPKVKTEVIPPKKKTKKQSKKKR